MNHTTRCRGVVPYWFPIPYLGTDAGARNPLVLKMEMLICTTCGTWLPLGPSDETQVAVEVRAAELAAEWRPGLDTADGASVRENIGALVAARDTPFVPTNDEGHASYLAHAIAHHDDEQAAGQTLSDGGTTEGA